MRARSIRSFQGAYWFFRFFRDPIACMRAMRRRFGDVVALGDLVPLRRSERRHVFAFGPEMNRLILGDENWRTTGQTMRGPPDSAQRRLRHGLTRMNGEQHRRQRRIIMPCLSRSAVQGYHDDFVSIISGLLDEWRPGTVNMWRQMRELSLRLSSRLLFGLDDTDRAERLARMIERHVVRNFSLGVWLLPVHLPGTPYRALLARSEEIEREILAMLADKRANPGRDVISRLVAEPEMTDAELVGQTNILFGASYETTGNALNWTLFLLAQHPQVANDLLDELDGVPLDALAKLPLLDAVIKESMRLLPPIPYTVRACLHGAELGPVTLRDGDRAICSHYMTHHLPELYPEPERFRPERWFDREPTQYEYLPFSAGHRICVGATFAMVEMRLALAMILPRWRFRVVPGTRIDRFVRVTLNPRRGIPMTLHPQDRGFEAVPVSGNIREMVELEKTG